MKIRTRTFGLLLALCMLLGAMSTMACAAAQKENNNDITGCSAGDNCPSRSFTDAPTAANWAHAGIDYCIEGNLMNGITDTVFSPNGMVTRGQLVTILYRAAGTPGITFSPVFSDVVSGKYYANAVVWASKYEYVKGFNNGKFKPDDMITREQLAAILYRYSGSPKPSGSLSSFSDSSDVSSYAKDAMIWATSTGLINGIKNDKVTELAPQKTATRAQIAAIIMRFLEKK